ncbi:MAG: hypothetical protein K9N11_03905 [Lentisphaeria bacterium]|nr:hypothetical protein [Candidatus Neomarinimicrobiota bacterium]MCF7841976.1 hypothetical protein [Lentisphaeria bacterium]
MHLRVHEILIVSSLYDAFILEEDGRLTELIFTEYQDMNLSNAPRVTRVSTAKHALQKLDREKYDMVITMSRLPDMHPFEFGKAVKESHPDLPVILLASHQREYNYLISKNKEKNELDKIFFWSGDSSLFTAIIKFVEDRKNAERDILHGGVRAIIVVEDSPQFYSVFLPMIYRETIKHIYKLMKREYTESLRLLRMRSRPKILLASNYEEAAAYFAKYQNNILAVISDVRYPRKGTVDEQAGAKLLSMVTSKVPDLPIVLQSKEPENASVAKQLNAYFLDKNSPELVMNLRKFVVKHCGFGELVFSSPDKSEICRVSDLRSLEAALAVVPAQSIGYHARRNHFSNWLAVRGYFEIADILRTKHARDFENLEAMRTLLLDLVRSQRKIQHQGEIIYFDPETYDPEFKFVRFGRGSLGGKGRGLAFMNTYMREFNWYRANKQIIIDIPHTAVLGTNLYDRFLEMNNIDSASLMEADIDTIDKVFLAGIFETATVENIKSYLSYHTTPLAVRSSSLLEDSLFQPFAGIYRTYMIPNNSPKPANRVADVLNAVKRVYASTFYPDARAYMEATGNRPEDEKMAVIIQNLVGAQHGNYFYPVASGLIQSHNFYPIGVMKREEGVVSMALGLGRTVMGGNDALRFSPKHPSVLPQFYNAQSVLKNSQKSLFVLPLTQTDQETVDSELKLSVKEAWKEGLADLVVSYYSQEDGRFYDYAVDDGKPIITLKPLLNASKWQLTNAFTQLIDECRIAMGGDVEIEFAMQVEDLTTKPRLYILQIRPQHTVKTTEEFELDEYPLSKIAFKSSLAMGNGINDRIRDIVYVKHQKFSPQVTHQIAREIGQLNRSLDAEHPYLLIGPGRWGTSDPNLGIPIGWEQISHARSMVELGLEDFDIDPSFGNHFFQNVTALEIGYFKVSVHVQKDYLDWKWLDNLPSAQETEFLRYIRLKEPLTIMIDGKKGVGLALKPKR